MTSWKTTLGGALTAAGASLMGVTILTAVYSKFGSHAMEVYVEQHIGLFFWTTFAGFILTVVGPILTGVFARDNNVTSEEVRADKAKETES